MNRLVAEQSLYLRQHATNPVNWHPWDETALALARREDRPLLVSIGYSACHWCHVMAHECFENDFIAALMNRHFVCIKVDREERPDLDQIFMEAVIMMNGHGGWPLNVFCLPDGRPFAGGTYFPPEDRGQGIIPWPQLLMRVADFYQHHRNQLEQNAVAIVANLTAANHPPGSGNTSYSHALLIGAVRRLLAEHDTRWGGFGRAPKFPPSLSLNFLLSFRYSASVEKAGLSASVDQALQTTLDRMACGGLYDQIGGGFARYSVDAEWRIPHFEKMLYDNALLLDAYSRAWRRYRHPLYQRVVEETIDWLQREMKSPNGGFYASLDADSEGQEGRYYFWTPQEICDLLGSAAGDRFCQAYDISEEGNFESGYSHPYLRLPNERDEWQVARQKLLSARLRRIPPARDSKIPVSWNALLARGLAEAALAFDRPDWFLLAEQIVETLWTKARRPDGRLYAVLYDSGPRHNGTLDDYAFLAEACLTLGCYADAFPEHQGQPHWDRVELLVAQMLRHFADPSGQPGCFFTSDDHETLAVRKKDWWDNATPSGNSSLLHVLAGLHAKYGREDYAVLFANTREVYTEMINRAPAAAPHALSAFIDEALGLAVVKSRDASALAELRKLLAARPWRRTLLLHEPTLRDEGFQLCIGTTCLPPETEARTIAEKI